MQLHEGKFWKCPALAYLPMQLAKFELENHPAWRPWIGYKPLEPGCTDAELAEFVAREDEHHCGMCPVRPQTFPFENPLIPVGQLLRKHAE